MYTIPIIRRIAAVGFKLADGMEVPAELASRFKFAKQKSKLAGTIRGSFFVIYASQVWASESLDRTSWPPESRSGWCCYPREGGTTAPPGFHQGRPFPAGVAGARFDTDRPRIRCLKIDVSVPRLAA